MEFTNSAVTKKRQGKPSKSFLITAAIWVLLLILFAAGGKFAVGLVIFAVFAIVSALYSLLFGRPSWLGLSSRKVAGVGIGAGFVLLLVAGVIGAATVPATEPVSQVVTTTTSSASPSPSAKSALYTKCTTATDSMKESGTALICTPGDDGVLVWLTESRSKELVAERAAVKAKAEAANAAAKKIEDDRAAAVAAEAAKVAAVNAAAQKAAADEAARVAAQQAAQQAAKKAPAPPVQAPPANVSYANCTAVKAAGAAPIYRGQPGYSTSLDRDGDGVACEK